MTTDREKFFEHVSEDEMYAASPHGRLAAAQNELAALKAEHARLREAAERTGTILESWGFKLHAGELRAALDAKP